MTRSIPDPTPQDAEKPRRRWFTALAALSGIGLVAGVAHAQDGGKPGWGWGRHRHMDPQEMARRLDYRIGYLIKEIGGTPQQKDRLVAIASAAMTELRPMREQLMQARRQGMLLLAAPAIDKPALESLRAAQLQLADAKSRRTLQSLIEAAEVLTPEQRAKLAEHMKRRMERHRG